MAALALFWGGERYRERDWLPWFRDHKRPLAQVIESLREPVEGGTISQLRLTDDRGLEVRATLKLPASNGPHPAIVTLGGARSGAAAISFLGPTGDLVVLALDYPYHGPRSSMSIPGFLRRVPEMRRAMLDTVPAAMLGVDYLLRRDDVDPARIVLVGGSLGALFAPAIAAADERITALALFFGAAELESLIEASLHLPHALRPPVAWVGAVIVSPLEPAKYIGRVAPRPVLLLNGTTDAQMPERNSRALQEAAKEPKTVRWLDLGHVHLRAPEFRREVMRAFIDWLEERSYVSAEAAEELRAGLTRP